MSSKKISELTAVTTPADTDILPIVQGGANFKATRSQVVAGVAGNLSTHAGLSTTAHGGIVSSGDARLTDARTPTAHKTSHEPGGGDAMTVDAAAATGSLRTLGTSATSACAGNDSRLSDARTPVSHASSHAAAGSDPVTPSAIGIGVPSAESASRDLVAADNSKTLVCTSTPTFTVNTGLPTGFGVAAKGACSFSSGTATVTDVRETGATNPWCALIQTGTDTYDIVGSKA